MSSPSLFATVVVLVFVPGAALAIPVWIISAIIIISLAALAIVSLRTSVGPASCQASSNVGALFSDAKTETRHALDVTLSRSEGGAARLILQNASKLHLAYCANVTSLTTVQQPRQFLKREGVLQPSQQVKLHLSAGCVSDCLSQNSQAFVLILWEFVTSDSADPAVLSASRCKVVRVPLNSTLSYKAGQVLHFTAGQKVLSSWDYATFLQQQLVVCKQLIKDGNYSAARAGLESILPQISSDDESMLKAYMMHAILIEAVLKNGTLLLSRCRDFLAMFPQTSSVLVTREMAYDYQESYDLAICGFQHALSLSNPAQPEHQKILELLAMSKQWLEHQSKAVADTEVRVGLGTCLLPTASDLIQHTAAPKAKAGGRPAAGEITEAVPADAVSKMTLPDLLADEGCVYNVLLIGETGSGKTTLLNMLVNYFRGDPHARTQLPSRQILKLAVPTSFLEATEPEGTQQTERDISDRSRSQSTKSVGYNFAHQISDGRAVSFCIVDTPGLGDTEGADDLNLDSILGKASSLSHISAVVMVANGSQCRQTVTRKRVYTLLRGHLPDAVLTNTLVVLTNCTKQTRNLDPQTLPVRVKPEYVFYMNNSAFSSDPDRWQHAPPHEVADVRIRWTSAMVAIDGMVASVLKLGAASSVAFKEIRQLRQNLKCEVQSSLKDIRLIRQLQQEKEAGTLDSGSTTLVMHTMCLTGTAKSKKLSDLVTMQQSQQQKMQQIKDTCGALQMLCSRFNLADELTVLLEGMRVQARQLDLMSARALANEAIQDLASFVKTLADEMPQMAMAEEPQYMYDSDDHDAEGNDDHDISMAPAESGQQVKQFTEESRQQTSGRADALPALAPGLHEKLAQAQLELADIKEYRLAAEHRQQLAAAAANMAAFNEDRLQAQVAALIMQVQQIEAENNHTVLPGA